jgi:propanol-preferring alcohol dehydrogenase
MEAAIQGLRPGGRVIALGATPEPIAVASTDLLSGSKTVAGAMTGTPGAGDDTLRFSVLTPVAAMIETMPLEQAPQAYARMMAGDARFRIVLTIA